MFGLLLPILTLSSFLTGYLAFLAWRARPAASAVPFAVTMACLAVWTFGYIFEVAVPGLEAKLFWVKVEYLGIAWMPVVWFWLAAVYTGQAERLHGRRAYLLAVMPLVVLAAVWTYPLSSLYWTSIEILTVGDLEIFAATFGPLFWVHVVVAYALSGVGAFWLVRMMVRTSSRPQQRGAVVLLLTAIAPVIGNLPYLFDFGLLHRMDLSPLVFALLSPFMALGILRFHLLDLFPLAFDNLVENMEDGLLLLDNNHYILYLNEEAARILDCEGQQLYGKPLDSLHPLANLRLLAEPGLARQEIRLERGGVVEHYEVKRSLLRQGRKTRAGKMLVLRNITESRHALLALRRRSEELSALNSTLMDIASNRDLPALLQAIVSRAVHLLDGAGGEIYLVEAGRQELKCLVSYACPVDTTGRIQKFGQGAAGRVALSGLPLRVEKYQDWEDRVDDTDGNTVVCGLVSAPMLWRDEVIGVLTVLDTCERRTFDDEDTEMLALFAGQAAIAVENTRLLEAEQRRAEEAETIRLAAMTISATMNQEDTVMLILEQLEKVVPYDSAEVQLYENGYLKIVGGRPGVESLIGMRFRVPGDNPNTRVILERRAVIYTDELQNFTACTELAERNVRSFLGVPLLAYGQVIGMLAILSFKENFFTQDHVRLSSAFAGHVAITIEKARLYNEAHQRAEELSRLYQAARDMAASLEPAIVLEQLARHITQAIDVTVGYIIEVSNEYAEFNLVAEYRSAAGPSADHLSEIGTVFTPEDFQWVQDLLRTKTPLCFHLDEMALDEQGRAIFENNKILSALIMPIMGRGQLLGAAILGEGRRRRDFTPVEMNLAQALAQHGAGVIENARLYNAVRHRADELEALRATMTDLSTELELPRLLEAIIDRAAALIGASGGDLGIYHPQTEEIEIVVSLNLGKDHSGSRMSLGEGAMGHVAQTRMPMIISDYATWPNRSPQYTAHQHLHGVIAVPLMMGSELLGALGIVDFNPRRQFTYADQYLISLFAQQAAIAIQNSRLYEAARKAAERRAILHQISQDIIVAHLNTEAIYESIHRAAGRIMPAEAFVIGLHEPEHKSISAVYLVDKAGRTPVITLDEGSGLSGFVISTGRSLIINDVLTFNEVETLQFGAEEEDVRSLVAVPMRLGDRVIGLLSCQCYQPNAYEQEDQSLLEMLAAYAAIAITNAHLFNEVQHLAVTDPLTGISNRRHFFALAQHEFLAARRFKRILSVVMIDLDNFKDINDTFGHQTGDQILVETARLLKENVRLNDILGRYGGDEFAILLPEANREVGMTIAERLRKQIEDYIFVTKGGEVCVSISVGVTTLTDETPSLESMLGGADAAMYSAKQSGRNRTVSLQQSIEPAELVRGGGIEHGL